MLIRRLVVCVAHTSPACTHRHDGTFRSPCVLVMLFLPGQVTGVYVLLATFLLSMCVYVCFLPMLQIILLQKFFV